MKRAIQGNDGDSEDEIWNYKCNRTGKSRQKDGASDIMNRSERQPSVSIRNKTVSPSLKIPKNTKNNKSTGLKRSKTSVGRGTASVASGDSGPSKLCKTSKIHQGNASNLDGGGFPNGSVTGYCPSCQVPFSSLVGSPDSHVMQCLDTFCDSDRPDCPSGANCTETLVTHYQKYSHSTLALVRAGCLTDESENQKSSEVLGECSRNNQTSNLDTRTNEEDENSDVADMFGSCRNIDNAGVSGECEKYRESVSHKPQTITSLAYKLDAELADMCRVSSLSRSVPSQDSGAGSSQCSVLQRPGSSREDLSSRDSQTDELFKGSLSQTDSIGCDLFDLPEMLSDVFDDDTLLAAAEALETGTQGASCEVWTSPNSATLTQSESIPNRISRSQSGFASPRKHNQKLKRTSTLGENKNLQQLSINSFFQKVGESSKAATPSKGKSAEVLQNGASCQAISAGRVNGEHERVRNLAVKNSRDTRVKTVTSGNSKAEIELPKALSCNSPSPRLDVKSVERPSHPADPPARNFRRCPFYKRIPNTEISVDAFSYRTIPGCSAYFLSHFHSDHYVGLTKNFPHHIYCNKVTANLVSLKIRVQPHLIHSLPMNTAQFVGDVEVTLLDANHCPGSVMMLFKLKSGQTFLHTGDFRADPSMENIPQLHSVHISHLFLDTTYCDPTYDFPLQKDVVAFTVSKTFDFMGKNPNTVVAVGTYMIGKERVFLAIAEALDCKIFVTRDKKSILACLEDKSLNDRLTLNPAEARLHVIRMNQLNLTDLCDYLEKFRSNFDHLLAFEPTGWTHNKKMLSLENLRPKASAKNVTVYAVPYSEHSSYSEMKRFVQFLRPEKIIPTVNNGNPSSRKKMEELFSAWMSSPGGGRRPDKTKQQIQLGRWLDKS